MSLLSDEVLAKINRVIVQLGHQAVGHQVDDILKARGDSFVVETDVEYPTDLKLLWDAGTCGDWATGASLCALGRLWLAPSQALAEEVEESLSGVRFLYGMLTFVPYVVSLSCQRNANCTIVIGGRCGHPVALTIEAWY